jgi:hypothetical protein
MEEMRAWANTGEPELEAEHLSSEAEAIDWVERHSTCPPVRATVLSILYPGIPRQAVD